MQDILTRRGLLASAGALALTTPLRAADKERVFDDSEPTRGVAIPSVQHLDEMAAAPLIEKKVNKLWNDSPTIKEPNALQFTPKGTLLILDQVDPNKVFEVNPSDGKVLRTVQTESIHGSGITIDGGGNWIITSTKALQGPPVTLKVDPTSGKTLQKWVTPGWGFYGPDRPPRPDRPPETPSGGHDVKWAGNGRYWMAVPASGRIFLMDEATGKPVRSLIAPVNRTHGLAIDGNFLWSVGSDFSQIHKLDSKTGKIVAKIQLDKKNDPAIHGLEIKNGVLWYCDAASGWVCNLT
jgi:sugar lactone lactonase YvrE